jgi:hypothetical protein
MYTNRPARVKSSLNTRNLTDVAEIKKGDRMGLFVSSRPRTGRHGRYRSMKRSGACSAAYEPGKTYGGSFTMQQVIG